MKKPRREPSVGAMLEALLAEWHVPPDTIVRTWSYELLDMMTRNLEERKKHEAAMSDYYSEVASREQDRLHGTRPLGSM